jgi:hypothetical protein
VLPFTGVGTRQINHLQNRAVVEVHPVALKQFGLLLATMPTGWELSIVKSGKAI